MDEWTIVFENIVEKVPIRILRHESGSLKLITRQIGATSTESVVIDDSKIFGMVINDGDEIAFEGDSINELITDIMAGGFSKNIFAILEKSVRQSGIDRMGKI